MYKVRYKEYEKKKWKIIAEFETKKEATKYAVQLDMRWRRNIDTMYNSIDIKYPDGTRFIIAP